MGLDSSTSLDRRNVMLNGLFHTTHLCRGFIKLNHYPNHFFFFFPNFYLKKLNCDNWFAKIAQDLTNSYQIYKNHPYENQKKEKIENLEP
jgi:hypothetical protein